MKLMKKFIKILKLLNELLKYILVLFVLKCYKVQLYNYFLKFSSIYLMIYDDNNFIPLYIFVFIK